MSKTKALAFTEERLVLDPRPMTIKEAAFAAHVSERTIWREISEGRLAVRRIRDTIRVTPRALQTWLESK
jgi:excisionase family DNA binding protein